MRTVMRLSVRQPETVCAFKEFDHDEIISRTESHLAMTGLGKNFTHEGVNVAHLSATDFE